MGGVLNGDRRGKWERRRERRKEAGIIGNGEEGRSEEQGGKGRKRRVKRNDTILEGKEGGQSKAKPRGNEERGKGRR